MATYQINLYFLGNQCKNPDDEVVRIEIHEGSEKTEETFANWAALTDYIEGKRRSGFTVQVSPHIKARCGYTKKRLKPIK